MGGSWFLTKLVGGNKARELFFFSDKIDAAEALRMGLAWKICEPEELLADARRHAEVLAAKPISSLIAVKEAMVEPTRNLIAAARAREDAYFAEMMGAPANAEALAEFTKGRSGTTAG